MKLDRKDSVNFTLRMTTEQRIELEKIANKEDRTVTNLINMVLKNYIERYNGIKKQGMEINPYPKFILTFANTKIITIE